VNGREGGIRVGCAGWAIPSALAASFPGPGTHLERYARVLPAVEINSTFYRSHRRETFERWAASVPATFRFSVKMPREITHHRRLAGAAPALRAFFHGVSALGSRLGPVLVQLPPTLAFEERRARSFLEALRRRRGAGVVLEPRHASWFTPAVGELLPDLGVARVAADPAPVPEAARPGGWSGLVYYRLHGSPRTYYSSYGEPFLRALAADLASRAGAADTWCVFDNTAAGAAPVNALRLLDLLSSSST
jgi:uncharacterized protein YecE (DUF72 family)